MLGVSKHVSGEVLVMLDKLSRITSLGAVALLCTLRALPVAAQSGTDAQSAPAPDTLQIPASEPIPAATCPPPDGTRPDAALVNTDPFVLARFPLQRVYGQILRLAQVSRPSATELYQQMWDSMDLKANAKFAAAHCDDVEPPGLNGFPFECPRPEASLKDTQLSALVPVALTNRFDLSPSDGANCGEYRMIFAMTPFNDNNRNFVIFEAVLPNPNPSCGLEACRPVANFWRSLANLNPNTYAGRKALADRLEQFYFAGLPGFQPVIHPNHYGMEGRGGYGGVNGGQIRTNMFVGGTTWRLREFRVARRGNGHKSQLVLEPATVKVNPFPALFDFLNPAADPRAAEFQAAFPAQVEKLANDDMSLIGMDIDDRFNAAESVSSGFNDDLVVQTINGLANGPNAFTTAIRAELTRLRRNDLTPLDIAERATTQTCAGCHMLAPGFALSNDGNGGPVWPAVRPKGFVHIDEQGFLSPALWCTFLPHRKAVLDGFAASSPLACNLPRPKRTVVTKRSSRLPASAAASGVPLTVSGKPFGPN